MTFKGILLFSALCASVYAQGPQSVTVNSLPAVSVTRDGMDWAALSFSVVLMVVGIIGVRAAIRTLRAVEEQAKEMVHQAKLISEQTEVAKVAADAALLNAQAVINAERARLLFTVEKRLDDRFRGRGIFSIYVINYGRAPAELLGSIEPVRMVTNSPDDLPVPIPDTARTPIPQQHLVPGDKYFLAEYVPASTNGMAMILAKETGASINDQFRIIYGGIEYRDGISDETRVSRYCFRFNREPFRNIGGAIEPWGPLDYRKCT